MNSMPPTLTLSGPLELGEALAQAVEAEVAARAAAVHLKKTGEGPADAVARFRAAEARREAALAAWRAAVPAGAASPAAAVPPLCTPVAEAGAQADAPVTGDEVMAFTDGACSGNPGPGGWGILVQGWIGSQVAVEVERCGGEPATTNNRMELLAAIQALEASDPAVPLTVVTDSAYVKDGISSWIAGWKKRGWRNSSGDPVKNQDLWQRLDALRDGRPVKWAWVKGHTQGQDAASVGNRRVDGLANRGMAPFKGRSL